MDLEPGRAHSRGNSSHSRRSLRMTGAGVVFHGGGVTRNYDIHLHTLRGVAPDLRVIGDWPNPLTISSGWLRARARPWNDAVTEPMIRLDRGGSGFLSQVTHHLLGLGATQVFSPALYPDSTRSWLVNGYEEHATLDVFERSLLTGPAPAIRHPVESVEPDWPAIVAIDRAAFSGFWGMSALGLEEAFQANRSAALLTISVEGHSAGYAIVGTHWGVAYLHRIAVHPDAEGRGLGRSLLSASIGWGASNGGRVMILNVRPDNERAQRLYRREGFATTGTSLSVLRHRAN
jgi:ribosomal-protein-alanine N-acetyltransferase